MRRMFSHAGQDIVSCPKSHGSYVDVRTGRRTIRGTKAKERVMSSNEKGNGKDTSSNGKVTKVRKCPPRCIICCTVSNPNGKGSKTTQTTIYCLICLVSLCTKRIGNSRTTCLVCFVRLDKTLFHVSGHMGVMLTQDLVEEQLDGQSKGESDVIK